MHCDRIISIYYGFIVPYRVSLKYSMGNVNMFFHLITALFCIESISDTSVRVINLTTSSGYKTVRKAIKI